MTDRRIVIGLDGGGTHTRALAVDLAGRPLAAARTGGASPHKTPLARENVQQAIGAVMSSAGRTAGDVAALTAGIAGLDGPEDEAWADGFTALPGLTCPRVHVNDAVVAHAGALEEGPGIVAIAGTGSIVFGVTEDGRPIRSYDFALQTPGASARHVAFDAVQGLLAGEAGPDDADFLAAVLEFWQVSTLEGLRERGAGGFLPDRFERVRRFGEMAPLVTAAAGRGSPLPARACDRAARTLGRDIRLVGGGFAGGSISVALVGGLACSPAIQAAVARVLAESSHPRYALREPALPGEAGAALLALRRAGVTDAVRRALRAPPGF